TSSAMGMINCASRGPSRFATVPAGVDYRFPLLFRAIISDFMHGSPAMPGAPPTRTTFALIAAAVAALLGYALYSQYVHGLAPCPLCITRRGFYLLAALFALAAAIQHPARAGRIVYSVLIALSALGGAAVAGRQVWLQHLP